MLTAAAAAPTASGSLDVDIVAKLFAPFRQDLFPTALDAAALMDLFNTSLSPVVPVSAASFSDHDAACPGLFVSSDARPASELAAVLLAGLKRHEPQYSASEINWTQVWGAAGADLPEYAAIKLDFDAVIARYAYFILFAMSDAT